jgi:hypothetical protein
MATVFRLSAFSLRTILIRIESTCYIMKSIDYILLFSAALLFPRCSHDDTVPVTEPVEIRVSAGFVAGGVESRSANGVYSTDILAGTDLPLSVVRLDQTSGVVAAYLPYTSTNTGGGTGAPRPAKLKGESGEIWMTFNQEETYLVRQENNKTKLIGWHPQVGSGAGRSTWSVDGLGNATVGFTVDGETDILMSNLVEGARNNHFGASGNGMAFKHLLTRFAVRVFTRSAALANEWGPVQSIKIKGKAQQCAVVLPGVDSTPNTTYPDPAGISFTGTGDLPLIYEDPDNNPVTIPVITGATNGDGFLVGTTLVGTTMVAPEVSSDAQENKITLEVVCEHKSGTVDIIPGTDIDGIFAPGSSHVLSLEFKNSIILQSNKLVDWGGETIDWDDYLLTADRMEFNLKYIQSSNMVILMTDAPVKPTLTLSNDADSNTASVPDWVTVNPLSTGTTDSNGLTSYTLTFGTTKNDGENPRTSYIRASVNGLTLAIRVTQATVPETFTPDGMTNCYMVVPGGTKTFKVTRAYEYDTNTNNTTDKLRVDNTIPYIGEFVTKVIWQSGTNVTASVNGFGNQAEVTVTTNNDSGNAVVKIFKKGDSSETPVWSYHIWVTDPATMQTWENTNQTSKTYIFMDRNLGATDAGPEFLFKSNGLNYQWGRKDPFPGGAVGSAAIWQYFYGIDYNGAGSRTKEYAYDPTDDTASIAAAISKSIRNPTTFYVLVSTTFVNWLPANKEDLWSSTDNEKTIYDPCPAGWRVPVRSDGTISQSGQAYSPLKGYFSSNTEKKWLYEIDGVKRGMNFNSESTNYLGAYFNFGFGIDGQTAIPMLNNRARLWTSSCHYTGNPYMLEMDNDGRVQDSFGHASFAYAVRCVKE